MCSLCTSLRSMLISDGYVVSVQSGTPMKQSKTNPSAGSSAEVHGDDFEWLTKEACQF